ncbi:hypothetical protein LFL96_36445 (plasmid) [Paraburkholderia sp. D15]|uniref:hypothetical protein n=1 Tax=Paraburkholderia sp. D15 TaxID=2880218 RepID=UPI00247A5D07|nr:hypothetical protein [Paraburkholderia sp. D15]WGS54976.1 hypothetical protein LFL96_36445 [Paraburkholderia sp. D15]
MQPKELVIVPYGDDLCFTHFYQGKPHLVKVTAEALAGIRVAKAQSTSRVETLRKNLKSIIIIAERKVDNGEIPVVYLRDVTAEG